MALKIPTPHINAKEGDFAKTVLMPGDPLRAKYIAETYLEGFRQVNSVRGILGFTGLFEDKEVSVMASGMGMPSISIYAHELFEGYGVENIIRVGTAGALNSNLKIGDIVVGKTAFTNSAIPALYGLEEVTPSANDTLVNTLCNIAEKRGTALNVGALFSSDLFYGSDPDFVQKWSKAGALAVEMEAAALYLKASLLNKRALAICTVSDSLVTGEATTSDQRQTAFNEMMLLALKTAAKLN